MGQTGAVPVGAQMGPTRMLWRRLMCACGGACSCRADSLLHADERHRRRGSIRTMENALEVMRHASQPLGPMGAEWLERQARALRE
jgi:hypothetical protein